MRSIETCIRHSRRPPTPVFQLAWIPRRRHALNVFAVPHCPSTAAVPRARFSHWPVMTRTLPQTQLPWVSAGFAASQIPRTAPNGSHGNYEAQLSDSIRTGCFKVLLQFLAGWPWWLSPARATGSGPGRLRLKGGRRVAD